MKPIGLSAGMIKTAVQMQQSIGLLSTVSYVTFGSFTNGLKIGNKEPVFWFDDETGRGINAVGLTNQGLKRFLKEDLPIIVQLFKGTGCKIRVSLAPLKPGDLAEMMADIAACPLAKYLDEIEVNGACPNHRDESGLHPVLAKNPSQVEALLGESQQCVRPVAFKIAPDTEERVLLEIVKLSKAMGIKKLVSANTRLISSLINGKQRLSVDKGGESGLPLLETGVEQIKTLSDILSRGGIEDIILDSSGGVLNANGYRLYEPTRAETIQVATLFYQFGVRGVQDLVVAVNS